MLRCILEIETRWCLNEFVLFLSAKDIRENRYISKLLHFMQL